MDLMRILRSSQQTKLLTVQLDTGKMFGLLQMVRFNLPTLIRFGSTH